MANPLPELGLNSKEEESADMLKVIACMKKTYKQRAIGHIPIYIKYPKGTNP